MSFWIAFAVVVFLTGCVFYLWQANLKLDSRLRELRCLYDAATAVAQRYAERWADTDRQISALALERNTLLDQVDAWDSQLEEIDHRMKETLETYEKQRKDLEYKLRILHAEKEIYRKHTLERVVDA